MSATWFDHAIATVAPRMAARRVMARQAFETLTRGYDGAARGRRTEGWRAPGSSADTEIGVAGALLRDRMRDLVRNNPHAAKAVAVLVNNIIGAGIMPRAASGDDTLDRKVDALFERWTAECDADGQLDFYGLQTLICREMVEAGEVLVRRRLRRASDGLPVPLQLQVLEADFLDATKSGAIGAGRMVQGIEFDPVGKRRAYWLHAEHPGDAYGTLQNGLQSRPVPATEIAHVYEKQRTQARGVPWGAPVIRSLRDLDDYEVAELVRKKTEACVTAIVFGDDEAQQGIAPSVVDADGTGREPAADPAVAARRIWPFGRCAGAGRAGAWRGAGLGGHHPIVRIRLAARLGRGAGRAGPRHRAGAGLRARRFAAAAAGETGARAERALGEDLLQPLCPAAGQLAVQRTGIGRRKGGVGDEQWNEEQHPQQRHASRCTRALLG